MSQQNIWQYFDRKVCLTLEKRTNNLPSRWPDAKKEFDRVGMESIIKFNALPAIGPHQSFTLSQKQILTDFLNSDNTHLLTLEDDVQFLDLQPLCDAVNDIYKNNIIWDILYLGGNIQDKAKMKRRNLYQVYNVWTTHAVAYTKFAASILLKHFPNENERMYDNYLGDMLKTFRAYMIAPMVAIQRPDFSDIWKQNVDYREIFELSNQKLKA